MKMRNRTLLFALVLTVTMASCSRFEDGPAFTLLTPKARLTGDWEIVDFIGPDAEYYLDDLQDGQRWFFEFEKDGDGIFGISYSYGGYSYNYSYDMEWELDGNELEVDLATSNSIDWEIQRLTNTELEMRAQGIGIDLLTWVFEKQ